LKCTGCLVEFTPICKQQTKYCNKKCAKHYIHKRWRTLNRERVNSYNRGNYRRYYYKRYGLTLEQYQSLVEKQGGRCAICKRVLEKILVVDHCHETGRVRGLLCDRCNAGLGMFVDNPLILKSAIEYLK
jgi:hypothetical protein